MVQLIELDTEGNEIFEGKQNIIFYLHFNVINKILLIYESVLIFLKEYYLINIALLLLFYLLTSRNTLVFQIYHKYNFSENFFMRLCQRENFKMKKFFFYFIFFVYLLNIVFYFRVIVSMYFKIIQLSKIPIILLFIIISISIGFSFLMLGYDLRVPFDFLVNESSYFFLPWQVAAYPFIHELYIVSFCVVIFERIIRGCEPHFTLFLILSPASTILSMQFVALLFFYFKCFWFLINE